MKKPPSRPKSWPRLRQSKRFSIENIRVAHSPLSNELVIYRHGKDPRLALDKRYATPEILRAVMNYFFHDVEDSISGIEQGFEINDDHYQVTVYRSRPKKPKVLHLLEEVADFDQTPEEAAQELKEEGVDVPAFLNRVDSDMKLFKLVPMSTPESDSPSLNIPPTCRCAGLAYDPDVPCPVPGHTKLGPHGSQP